MGWKEGEEMNRHDQCGSHDEKEEAWEAVIDGRLR